MRIHLRFFLLIVGCCMIQCISFAQEDINKECAVKFSGYKTKISKQASATVDSIASAMKSQLTWNYAISCCMVCKGPLNAANWDRVNNIVNELVTQYGIAVERVIFWYDNYPANCNEIRFRYTDQKISTDPPPHPNLRKKNTETPCIPTSPAANY